MKTPRGSRVRRMGKPQVGAGWACVGRSCEEVPTTTASGRQLPSNQMLRFGSKHQHQQNGTLYRQSQFVNTRQPVYYDYDRTSSGRELSDVGAGRPDVLRPQKVLLARPGCDPAMARHAWALLAAQRRSAVEQAGRRQRHYSGGSGVSSDSSLTGGLSTSTWSSGTDASMSDSESCMDYYGELLRRPRHRRADRTVELSSDNYSVSLHISQTPAVTSTPAPYQTVTDASMTSMYAIQGSAEKPHRSSKVQLHSTMISTVDDNDVSMIGSSVDDLSYIRYARVDTTPQATGYYTSDKFGSTSSSSLTSTKESGYATQPSAPMNSFASFVSGSSTADEYDLFSDDESDIRSRPACDGKEEVYVPRTAPTDGRSPLVTGPSEPRIQPTAVPTDTTRGEMLDMSLFSTASDATDFMTKPIQQRRLPVTQRPLQMKDDRRRAIAKSLKRIGRQLKHVSKRGTPLKTLALL